MASSASNIPWSQIGSEQGYTLIAQCDKISRIFADALEDVRGATIPDFQSAKWRYEFCILIMFWLWYVAKSPKFAGDEATKPLLDAYHRECSRALLRAKLIEKTHDALRRWQDDVEARFLSYKAAYDGRLADIREDPYLQSLNITGRGTVGWLLVDQLFPGAQPDSRVVTLLNEFGSVHFHGLVEMFTNLEKDYARTKPR
jgi:hypothetical protein